MLAAPGASGLAPPSARFGFPEPSRSAAAQPSWSVSPAGVSRRRSLRLSAKKEKASTSGDIADTLAGSSLGGGPSVEPAPSDVAEGESIASAIELAPSDWHLEFFMDDRKLPLDLTIYGAIQQHEMCKHKASGSPFLPSMI